MNEEIIDHIKLLQDALGEVEKKYDDDIEEITKNLRQLENITNQIFDTIDRVNTWISKQDTSVNDRYRAEEQLAEINLCLYEMYCGSEISFSLNIGKKAIRVFHEFLKTVSALVDSRRCLDVSCNKTLCNRTSRYRINKDFELVRNYVTQRKSGEDPENALTWTCVVYDTWFIDFEGQDQNWINELQPFEFSDDEHNELNTRYRIYKTIYQESTQTKLDSLADLVFRKFLGKPTSKNKIRETLDVFPLESQDGEFINSER